MRRALPALLAVALALAGCGGGGDDTSSSPARSAPTASTGPTGATSAAPTADGPRQVATPHQPMEGTVVGVVRDVGPLTTFYATLLKAGVADRLSTPGPFTVFAPSNAALSARGVEGLLELLRSPRLGSVVLSHVVAGRIDPTGLEAGDTLRTLAGTSLDVARSGDRLTVGGAELDVTPPYPAQNGLVYVLDGLAAEP